jgi:hypothetical protein
MYAAPLVVEYESDGGIDGGTPKRKARNAKRLHE